MHSDQISTPIVDLYTVELDVPRSELADCWRLLDPAERARADRFKLPQLRRRWIVARAGLRRVLSRYCSTRPEQLRFEYETHGKPVLAEPFAQPDLHFNLSHSHDLALIGVTRSAPIGIDIEHRRPLPDWQAIASHVFSSSEYRQLTLLPEEQRLDAFYRCWTSMEATVKATGEGLSACTDDIEVSVAHPEIAGGYISAVAVRTSRDVVIEQHSRWRPPNTKQSGALVDAPSRVP